MRRGITVLAAAALALSVVAGAGARSSGTTITGAGSTLVAPLVSEWVKPLQRAYGYDVQYSAVGSGAGIAQITARTVDFGASDAPLTPDQATACKSCIQIPWGLSATTLSYNVPGVPNDLHLTGPVIAAIYLGQITNWNSSRIRSLNPKATLPDLKITPVFRSDGSGDTYAFTDYLSRISPTWKTKVGNATAVQFPTGLGGKGNSGVSGVIAQTKGAIGYISAAYLIPRHLKVAAVQNASGYFALPGLRGIAAAAATVKSVPANDEMHIVDPPKGARLAYPISTFTYIIVPTASAKAAQLRKMIYWALTQGQASQYTTPQVFVPIPKVVLAADEKAVKQIQ
jgi:phosphate transport system substrate-binding protein